MAFPILLLPGPLAQHYEESHEAYADVAVPYLGQPEYILQL